MEQTPTFEKRIVHEGTIEIGSDGSVGIERFWVEGMSLQDLQTLCEDRVILAASRIEQARAALLGAKSE